MMSILGFVITLSLLVLIHEWGHYCVARLFGVRILAFSLGFGRVLLDRVDRHGCHWRLSALPFGGYVKMLSEKERADYEKEGLKFTESDFAGAFERKSVWQRFLVVLAGPAMNILLAVVLYAGIAMVGTYEPGARLGTPAAQTEAARLGVEQGWVVRSVNDRPVQTYNDLRWALLNYGGQEKVTVLFEQNSGARSRIDFNLRNMLGDSPTDPAVQLGLVPYLRHVMVARVLEGSAAQHAGLVPGDRLLQIDGQPIDDVRGLIDQIQARPGSSVLLTVLDVNDRRRTVDVVLGEQVHETRGRIGKLGASLGAVPEFVLVRKGPVDATAVAVRKVWDFVALTVKSVGRMIVGEVSVKSLSGPIAIGDMAGQSMQNGLLSYLIFLAMISISLGVINLFPIPVLDGGHLLYYSYEIIMRRPPSDKVIEIGQKIGIGFVLVLSVFAMGNDIVRVFGLH